MAPPLTVRNLTSTTITLKSLERFEDPNTKQSKATAFPSALKNAQLVAPSAPELGLHVQSFKRVDVGVELAPFESYTLRLQALEEANHSPTSALSSTTLRLTIEDEENQPFRIDTNPTYTQKGSRKFTPLTPNPSTSYTALYHPTTPTAHLTIHAHHLPNYARWMQSLPDTLPLSAISIPGTHNSHTHYRALPSVRCQIVDVATQLENGIRFLDIRVQPASATDTLKRDLYLVHGAFPISLTGIKYLDPVINACYAFLDANPSETILVSLKREGVGSATDPHLATILQKHYFAPNASKWYTGTAIPYLHSARGKLVLVRRYEVSTSSSAFSEPEPETSTAPGLDATAWPNNSTHALHGPFCVQDFCEIMHPSFISDKLTHANAQLVRAASATHFIPGVNTDVANPVPPGPLYLNFLSGSNFFNVGTWPEKIARVVNKGVEEWMCTGHHLAVPVGDVQALGHANVDGVSGVRGVGEGDGGVGVVIMDMVGEGGNWDLVRLVVGMNMGILEKVRKGM